MSFIHLFLRIKNNFIVYNIFTYLDLHTKAVESLFSWRRVSNTAKPASRIELMASGDPPIGFLAVPTSTQRAGGQKMIGIF